jgi:hypothetical protein
MDARRVAAFRAARHGLVERVEARYALDVAARLCGLHAQVLSSAELTVWARVEGLQRGWVERALWEERSLVKLWAMRGTLHLLRTDELAFWLAALGTYEHFRKPVWLRNFGISESELDALIADIPRALAGRALTREELAGVVGEHVRGSWGMYLKPVSFAGGLCFAPNIGRNVAFTTPREWVGVEPDGAADLAEVARRYLRAYGPATREDLARWWGVTPPAAGRMLAALGDEAATVEVGGVPARVLAEDVGALAAADPAGSVALLPAFDQYVAGAPRTTPALFPGDLERDGKAIYRPQGWLSPVLVVDGRIEGVWRHAVKGKRVDVTIEPFGKQPRRVLAAAEAEADRLREFLSAPR